MFGRDRKPSHEYEGWWEVVDGSPTPDLHGKIEWEPSTDGGTEIDLLVSDVSLPDGAELEVLSDGAVNIRGRVSGGSVRELITSQDGHTVPNLAGKAVELRHSGTLLARTVLQPD